MREEYYEAEPWVQEGCAVLNKSRVPIATAFLLGNARRIVAAVNAVEGIPTAALEGGVVRELLVMARAPGSDLRNAQSRLRAESERSRSGREETDLGANGVGEE